MTLIDCQRQIHSAAILAILNDAILHTTALYDYRARTPEAMAAWFDAKEKGKFPVIGLEEDGVLAGFASYGTFRAWPAFKYSVEHSVYVDGRFRRRGVARRLMQALIARAEAQGYHTLIGGIDAENQPSIDLHLRLGFRHCASIKQAGFKFGRWLDLEFYQLILKTPAHPADG